MNFGLVTSVDHFVVNQAQMFLKILLLQGFDPGEDTYQVGDKSYLIL